MRMNDDLAFLGEIIAQICDYAVAKGMKPTDTVRTVANDILLLTEISNFDNWKPKGGDAE